MNSERTLDGAKIDVYVCITIKAQEKRMPPTEEREIVDATTQTIFEI